MTVPEFATYTEPEFEAGDEFKPRDNIGRNLIVQVNELKPSVVTSNSPDGAPALIVDLVDLDDPAGPKVYRDAFWMGGAVVDGLKAHVGTRKPVLIKFEARKSKAGRTYPAPAPVDAAASQKAADYYKTNGDPFAQTFAAPTAPAGDEPPF